MPELRLFLEANISSPAEWIPYLPPPGAFKHPKYGDLSFTPERNARFVANFNNRIYQDRVPLDAEHQTKLSGALGWIASLRQNEDSSVDAQVEWTDRGASMVTKERFKYVSPEFYDSWEDPATGVSHQDVAIGGALTTRPFFKSLALRPLVASEDGTLTLGGDDIEVEGIETAAVQSVREDNNMAEKTAEVVVDAVDAKAFAEVQLRLTELQEALATSEEQRTEVEQKAQKYQEALDTTNSRLAKMEESAQTKRFTEWADGHDGPRWFGEVETHVRIMRALGEGSDEYAAYVASQKAQAAMMAESSLFSEIGSDATGKNENALAKLNRLADARQVEKPSLSHAQAFAEVLDANSDLYTAYRKGE